MLIHFWFGQLFIGRAKGVGPRSVYDFDICVALYLWPRGIVPDCELPWHYIIRLTWNWLPDRIYRRINLPPLMISLAETTDSARWTGRDRKFIGFGAWRRQLTVHRTTWRSKMFVYLTGQKDRASPRHTLYVCPGKSLPENEIPSDWKIEGTNESRTFPVVFKHGRAEVDSKLGEYMIQAGIAQRTNIIRPAKALLGSLAARIAGN